MMNHYGKIPEDIRNKPQKGRKRRIAPKRFRKIRWFFFKVLVQVILWDVIFDFPGLRWLRPPAVPRWQAVAKKYRVMAMEMGGVLIKLGQFLSTRVDLLPPEVTRELSGLQDNVAPAPTEAIISQVEADFACPISDIFSDFSDEPMGAASLAQAHSATLENNRKVVVKVLRPGIDILVMTDLAVMDVVCKWLSRFKHVRSRMNLNQLMEEFTATTMRELDLLSEMENFQQFAKDFRHDPHVHIPEVFETHCALRTLTMENVAFIKIDDIDALNASGVSRSQVADRLYNIYMKQIFITNFIHVDPHPGNLFVRPLPTTEEIKAGCTEFAPGECAPYCKGRAFQIVFIDFGMTAVIQQKLKAAMRMGAIGIGTRDARKVVQAYVAAGIIQKGVDLRRLEEAHEDWFQRIWGLGMGKIHEVAFKEARYFFREYKDLIADIPFQLQSEMLFVGRAVGILSGIAIHIDPDFDPWEKTLPYAKRFAKEELMTDWKGLPEEFLLLGRHALNIPTNLDHVLDKAKQGTLAVQVSLSPETRKAIKRIDLSVKRFSWMVLAAGLLVSGVNLYIARHITAGLACNILAVLVFMWGNRKV